MADHLLHPLDAADAGHRSGLAQGLAGVQLYLDRSLVHALPAEDASVGHAAGEDAGGIAV